MDCFTQATIRLNFLLSCHKVEYVISDIKENTAEIEFNLDDLDLIKYLINEYNKQNPLFLRVTLTELDNKYYIISAEN